MPKNSRKHPRFPMSGLVVVKAPEKNIQCSGTIEMISLGGIGVYTREKIDPGTPVTLEIISFIGGVSANYGMTGRIRNQDRNSEFGVLGVEYEKEITQGDYPKLFEILSSLSSRLVQYNNS